MGIQAFTLEVSGSEPMDYLMVYDAKALLEPNDVALGDDYELLERLVPQLQVMEEGGGYTPAGQRCPSPMEEIDRGASSYYVSLCSLTSASVETPIITSTTPYQVAFQVAPYAVAHFHNISRRCMAVR